MNKLGCGETRLMSDGREVFSAGTARATKISDKSFSQWWRRRRPLYRIVCDIYCGFVCGWNARKNLRYSAPPPPERFIRYLSILNFGRLARSHAAPRRFRQRPRTVNCGTCTEVRRRMINGKLRVRRRCEPPPPPPTTGIQHNALARITRSDRVGRGRF